MSVHVQLILSHAELTQYLLRKQKDIIVLYVWKLAADYKWKSTVFSLYSRVYKSQNISTN